MEAESLPEAFKIIIDQNGWSQSDLARNLGKGRDWVSRILSGERSTSIDTASEVLGRVRWKLRITPETEDEDEPVKRREFISGAASVAFVPTLGTSPYHESAYVRMLARRVTEVREETGAASMAKTILGRAAKINPAAMKGSRDLCLAASEYMRRGAYALLDAEDNRGAVDLANGALACAQRAGDYDKQAAAHATAGFMYGMAGNIKRAVENTSQGMQIPEMSDGTRAWLSSCQARVLAKIPGHERQAREAVELSLQVDKLSNFEKIDVTGMAGNTLRNIRANRQALDMLSKATVLSEDYSPLYRAAYLIDQIEIALNLRDLEPGAHRDLAQGAHFMKRLSYVFPLVDSAKRDAEVAKIITTSRRWISVPELREARAQLQAVVQPAQNS